MLTGKLCISNRVHTEGEFEERLVLVLKSFPFLAEFKLCSEWDKVDGDKMVLDVRMKSRAYPVSYKVSDLEKMYKQEGMVGVLDHIVTALIDKMALCESTVPFWPDEDREEEYARWKNDPEYARLLKEWEECKKTPEFAKIVDGEWSSN